MFNLMRRSLAVGLVVATAGFPTAAQAMYRQGPGPSSSTPGSVSSRPSGQQPSSGFQWGDAGIGAAGAVVLLGAGALGTGAMRRRRPVVS
jgi:hypothetical protein